MSWTYDTDLEHVTRSKVTIKTLASPTAVRRRIANGVDPFRLVVSGSRSITSPDAVDTAFESAPDAWRDHPVVELVVGGADGVDTIAENKARMGDWPIDVLATFEPDWSVGPKAGPLRNEEMVEYADALLAVWDGHSNGTRDTIEKALDHGLDVYVETV